MNAERKVLTELARELQKNGVKLSEADFDDAVAWLLSEKRGDI